MTLDTLNSRTDDRPPAWRHDAWADASVQDALHRLTRLACRALPCPIAIISLVDGDRLIVLGASGLPESPSLPIERLLHAALCRHAIQAGKPWTVSDVGDLPTGDRDPLFETLGIRSVAAAPIEASDGTAVGCLSVLDVATRAWSDVDVDVLHDLAKSAGSSLEGFLLSGAVHERSAELERTQRELAESEANFRNLFDSNPMSMWVFDAETLAFLEVNESAIRRYGYSHEEFLRMRITDIRPAEDVAAVEYAVRNQRHKVRLLGEWRHLLRDGTVIQVNITSHSLKFAGRNAVLVVADDVTERWRAESALRESEARNRLLVRNVPDLLFRLRDDGVIIDFHATDSEDLPLSPTEISGRNIADIFPAAIAETAMAGLGAALKSGDTQVLEYRLSLHRGLRDYEARIVPNGEHDVLLVARDITERKQAEARLEESEQRYKSLFDLNIDAVTSMDIDGNFVSANPAAQRITGYSEQELQRTSFLDLVVPEHRQRAWRTFQLVLSGRPRSLEISMFNRDGLRVELKASGVPMMAGGEAVGIFVVAEDVTETKRTSRYNHALAEAVIAERERLDDLLQAVPGIVWETWDAKDPLGRANFVSSQLETMLGYSTTEWLSRPTFWIDVIHPDDRERVVADSREQYLSCGGGISSFRYIARDGRVVWVESYMAVVCNEAGEPVGTRGVTMDVTDRMRTAEALRESEERYRLAGRATNDVIWDWDIITGEVTWSEGVETVFRYGPDEMEHNVHWWEERIHPDDVNDVLNGMQRAVESEEFWDCEYRFHLGNGAYATLLDRGYVIRDNTGRPARMIGSTVDITERKQTEEAQEFLAEAGKALATSLDVETTLDNMAHLCVPGLGDYCTITTRRADGVLQQVAARHRDPDMEPLLRLLRERYPLDEDTNHPVARVLASGQPEIRVGLDDDWAQREALDPNHLELIRVLGIRSYIVVPLQARGRLLGVAMFVSTTSGRQYNDRDLALAEELARRAALAVDNAWLYQKLAQDDKAKDEFLAMLGHELRNPLGAISNVLQLMRLKGVSDSTFRSDYGILDRQTRHMARLVDDLLDVSRITRGKIELRCEATDLVAVVAHALQTAQPLIEARGHAVTVSLPDNEVLVEADPVRIGQVFTNLLSNAAKYSEDNGRIWVTMEREDGEVAVHLRDSGLGIPHDLMPHIFNLFTQADRSLDRSEGGLGIGLTVARSLVEMHGGTLQAYSDGPGKGSEFVVRLPVAALQPKHSAGSTDGHAGETAAAERRVLVVDDNVDAAEALRAILNLWGYSARVAYDGQTAVEVTERTQPHVVLLDIGLPGMDGFEVARRLREIDGFDGLVIALTGYGQEQDKERSKRAGFDHHLVKPVDLLRLEELLAATSAV